MAKICWHYDLLYFGGIEQSMASLLEQMNKNEFPYKGKMICSHREQYFTQEKTKNRIMKSVPIINTDDITEMENDIVIFAGLIFDYKIIFQKLKANKYIGWVHFIPGTQAKFENMLLYPEYYEKITDWVCVSEIAKNGLLSVLPNLDPKHIHVIHNSIDENKVKEMANIPININAPDNTLKLVTSARISKEKGFARIIKFCELLEKANIPYIWYLIGGGVDNETINLINEALLKHNLYTPGYLDNPYNIIKQCDYGVLLSDDESWGIFPDECHILGVPTITTNFKAIYERKNIDKYGIIVNRELTNVNFTEILEKKDILKENLKSYHYENDLNKWKDILK